MRRLRHSQGFTLIELLIAVLVVGILAAIALPAFNKQRERAKDSAAQQALEAGLRAAKAVYADGESFPASGLGALLGRAERSRNFADGTGFPATGLINVDRRAANDLVLRTTSASGNQHMLRLEEPDSRVTRYGPPASGAASGGALISYTNRLPNPSAENDLACWSTSGTAPIPSVFERIGNWADSGSWSVRVVSSPAMGTYRYLSHGLNCTVAVITGERYFAALRVRVNSRSGGQLYVAINWVDSSNGYLGSSAAPNNPITSGEERFTVSGTAPAGAARAHVILMMNANTAGMSADVQVDSAMLVQTDTTGSPGYLDGSTPGGAWSGAAHNSSSTGPAGASTW